MPLPLVAPDTSLLRFRLVYGDVPRPAHPSATGDLTLTREKPEGQFYTRDKLSGGPFVFTGEDFRLLNALNRSTARCTPLGLLVQHRGSPDRQWETWRGTFTCNDCSEWNEVTCSVKLTPTSADPYQKLLDNYDKEYNILLTPGRRSQVTAELVTLATGVTIEFIRVGQADQADYLGTDGWSLFLQNTSWIPDGNLQGMREVNNILFRYRLRNVPMTPNGQGGYVPVDKSGSGYQVLQTSFNGSTGTVDYVREPGIAGFKPYKIGTYSDWNDPREPGSSAKYGPVLLLIDANKNPVDYGYDNADYIAVTGPDGGYTTGNGGGGANSAECGGTSLRVRRYKDDEQCSKLLWRFGTFAFGRCFRLLDGLYSLLRQTVLPFGGDALIPPTANQLSTFLTAATNPATGEAGSLNEIPRLLLSAGSDVKRYGSSEAATRLLISLKQLLGDMAALWDAGWFVDPATGWLRFEDRSYFEAMQAAGSVVVVAETLEQAILSHSYDYLTQLLPRYEDLVISNGSTEVPAYVAYFGKASLDYGLGACVNQREGQNRVTLTASRLTGDVAAGVLNGDSIPDNALFVLAPDQNGRLTNANRELSASQLLLRYYRRGRAALTATVEGPAPATAPNTVTNALPVSGVAADILTVRPTRQQAPISGRLPALALFGPTSRYTTNLGENGQLAKLELNLRTREAKFTPWLPPLQNLTDPPAIGGRQFDDSFNKSFD